MNVAIVQDPNVCWKGVPTVENKTVVQTTPTALYSTDTFAFGARIRGGSSGDSTITANAADVYLYWSSPNTGGAKCVCKVPPYDLVTDNVVTIMVPEGVAVNLKYLFAQSASAAQVLSIETFRNLQ